MIVPIRTLGDPVLREHAKPVTEFDRSSNGSPTTCSRRCTRLRGWDSPAPRSGSRCACSCSTMDRPGRPSSRTPNCSTPSDTVEEEEGCLSIPGPYHLTPRSARIRCRGRDAKGNDVEMEGEGLLARIFQHETDHLDGLLYIDRLDEAGRREVLADLRRFELGLQEPRAPRRPE